MGPRENREVGLKALPGRIVSVQVMCQLARSTGAALVELCEPLDALGVLTMTCMYNAYHFNPKRGKGGQTRIKPGSPIDLL